MHLVLILETFHSEDIAKRVMKWLWFLPPWMSLGVEKKNLNKNGLMGVVDRCP
jgi:hypothetical protein